MAGFASGALAEVLEDLIETLNVALRLLEVTFKGALQILRGRGFRHLGQGFGDLLFRGVEILQLVQ